MFTAVKRKVKRKTISNKRKGKCIVFPKHTNVGKFQKLLLLTGTPANLSMCRELYVILLREVIFFVYPVLPEPDIQNFIKTINFFLYRRSYRFFLLLLRLLLLPLSKSSFLLTT